MKALLLILALTINGSDLRQPAHVYQASGTMAPNGQLLQVLPQLKADTYLKVEALGSGVGDLDCYLLRYNTKKGWTVAVRDEDKRDGCSITYLTSAHDLLKLWVANHGMAATNYDITVVQ